MSEGHSTTPIEPGKPADTRATPANGKPAKPSPDFPLFPHATRRWAKKIRGQLHYFGPWDDPDGALKKYNEQKEALHAGRTPRPDPNAITVKDAVKVFLTHKKALLDAGELSPHTWAKYKTGTDLVIAHFGKSRLAADLDAQDFAALRKRMAAKWGIYRLADMIQHVRSIFKHAHDAGLLPLPVCFGPGFARPSKKAQRLHRAEQGPRLFTADEIRRMIAAATVNVRAMLLLAINCGFGNADCGNLPLSAVNLETGWIDYPRPKTGIERCCPLWSETVAALREVLVHRPKPKHEEDAGRFFLTRLGDDWAKVEYTSPLVLEFRKLLKRLGINGRKGLGFYTIRHVFRTIADGAKDQPAADYIMGHEVAHMSSVSREGIDDERLQAVAEHVRQWLFPQPPTEEEGKPGDQESARPTE
jgi:site-specific recombinase XerC